MKEIKILSCDRQMLANTSLNLKGIVKARADPLQSRKRIDARTGCRYNKISIFHISTNNKSHNIIFIIHTKLKYHFSLLFRNISIFKLNIFILIIITEIFLINFIRRVKNFFIFNFNFFFPLSVLTFSIFLN